MKPIDEQALLTQARSFNLDALGVIYDTYSPGLYFYALRLLGDAQLAEDCVADTFQRFLQALKNGRGPNDYLQAYLYRVAHNWITDSYRRSPPPSVDLEDTALDNLSKESYRELEDCIARDKVRKAMHRLTPEQRQVLVLKFVEGWDNDSIARAIEKPTNAVKSLQHRAINSLRRMLTHEEYSLEGIDER
jgi:RNA polymerase sigma-70 factor (ECF subfamily)